MDEVEGFILAGGASSRMGTDKAALTLCGETFIARTRRELSTVVSRISVVSSHDAHVELGLPVVRDLRAGVGALGGLHAALASCRARWALVVSCDLPFATAQLFARLASLASAEFDAVAPVQPDSRPQPLCALYAQATCLVVVERLLDAGELRPRMLLEEVRTRWIAPAELSDLPGAQLFFTNVNTREEYERAKERMKDEG